VIEAQEGAMSSAIFRFLSRNETKPMLKASEEDMLDEIVAMLRDRYEEDLKDGQQEGPEEQDEHEEEDEQEVAVAYPKFAKAAKTTASDVKLVAGYKRLLAVPAFTLALVMLTRVHRHFRRATWFKVGPLGQMLESHGAVRS
jgi:hypothetical protein